MTLRTPNYGNYGIFLIMGNAGFCPSTVSHTVGIICNDTPLIVVLVQLWYYLLQTKNSNLRTFEVRFRVEGLGFREPYRSYNPDPGNPKH